MSVLDRAIIKAFERRGHSAPAEKPPAVNAPTSEPLAPLPSSIMPEAKSAEASTPATTPLSNEKIGHAAEIEHLQDIVTQSDAAMNSKVPEGREIATAFVDRERQYVVEELTAKPKSIADIASGDELSQRVLADINRATLLNADQFEGISEPSGTANTQESGRIHSATQHIPDGLSILKTDQADGGPGDTVAPPSLNPTPQPWKWPEICEQLDQFTGEGFQQLAGHLQLAAEQGHKVLAFVSSQPNAGRTSVLMTLTRILALEGKSNVLLIDADHRHPNIATLTDLHPAIELKAVLSGTSRTAHATIPMTPGRISVLPLVEPIAEGEWRKLATTFRILLHQARRDYDMILIDAGVFGAESKLTDCWLRGIADAVVTVSRQLPVPGAEHVVLDWKQIGIESLGVIETFA